MVVDGALPVIKIKIFMWLLLKKKILTWDVLQSKGFSGLGRCYFCKSYEESAQHIFVSYSFLRIFGGPWDITSYSMCLGKVRP